MHFTKSMQKILRPANSSTILSSKTKTNIKHHLFKQCILLTSSNIIHNWTPKVTIKVHHKGYEYIKYQPSVMTDRKQKITITTDKIENKHSRSSDLAGYFYKFNKYNR